MHVLIIFLILLLLLSVVVLCTVNNKNGNGNDVDYGPINTRLDQLDVTVVGLRNDLGVVQSLSQYNNSQITIHTNDINLILADVENIKDRVTAIENA